MNWFVKNMKEYANFSGRARRQEYWMFALFVWLFEIAVMIVGAILDAAVGNFGGYNAFPVFMMIFLGIFGLAIFIPALGVLVRRLHDTGKSGWWILITFVPYIGSIVLFIFTVLDSTPGTNQYGPNPKGIEGYQYSSDM